MKKIYLSLMIIALSLCACSGNNQKSSFSNTEDSNSGLSDYSNNRSTSTCAHTPLAPVEEDRIEATCTTAGSYDLVTYCSKCQEEITRETVSMPAKGHNLVHHDGKAATCEEIGWYPYDSCTRCDFSSRTEINALQHDFVRDEDTLEYTCTREGCGATNGRDYEMHVSFDTHVLVGDRYSYFNPSFYFVNDDNALDLGWYALEVLDNDENVIDTIDKTRGNGQYEFPDSYYGNKVAMCLFVVILNETNVKLTNQEKEIDNIEIYREGDLFEKKDKVTGVSFYDGTPRDGYFFRLEFGTIDRRNDA